MASGNSVSGCAGVLSFSEEGLGIRGLAFCREKISPALRVAAVAAVLFAAMAWMGAASSLTLMGALALSFTTSILLESVLGDRYGKILKGVFPFLRERAPMAPLPTRRNSPPAAPLPAAPSTPAPAAPAQSRDQNLPPAVVKSPGASSNAGEQAASASALPVSSASSLATPSPARSSSRVKWSSLSEKEKTRHFSRRALAFDLKNMECSAPLNSSSSSGSPSTWFTQEEVYSEVVSEDPVGFAASALLGRKAKLSSVYTMLKTVTLSDNGAAELAAYRDALSWFDTQRQSAKKRGPARKALQASRKIEAEELPLQPMQREFDPTRPSFQSCIGSGLVDDEDDLAPEDQDAEPLVLC